MAQLWRGVIREYADRLPGLEGAPVVTLQEGGTPLIPCDHLSELTGARVHVKYEGLNPTASFKDRGGRKDHGGGLAGGSARAGRG